MPPLAAVILGLVEVRLAMVYDIALEISPAWLRTVIQLFLAICPAPTPDETRPLNELSLIHNDHSEADFPTRILQLVSVVLSPTSICTLTISLDVTGK